MRNLPHLQEFDGMSARHNKCPRNPNRSVDWLKGWNIANAMFMRERADRTQRMLDMGFVLRKPHNT